MKAAPDVYELQFNFKSCIMCFVEKYSLKNELSSHIRISQANYTVIKKAFGAIANFVDGSLDKRSYFLC